MTTITDEQLKNLANLIEDIKRENSRQIDKWGVQSCSPFEWITWLTEETGELAQAVSEHYYRGKPKEEIYKEAIQVASLALKIAEIHRS